MRVQKNILKLSIGLLAISILAIACSKTEEPPISVGKPIAYQPSVTKTLAQLLDSVPQATIYKAAWNRADLKPYIDSLRGNDTTAPYTLLVPTDAAFQQAGYTLDIVNNMQVAKLNLLLRYLAITGNVTPITSGLSKGTITYYPLTYPVRTNQGATPFNFYKLSIAYTGTGLLLNGWKAANSTVPIWAIDGAIYLIDSLVTAPAIDSYTLVKRDTTYKFYYAALQISDSIYTKKGLSVNNPLYVDTALLQVYGAPTKGGESWCIFFIPNNDAFRKAGLNSVSDIRSYINRSALARNNSTTPPAILTNMDSVLANNRVVYNRKGPLSNNQGANYLYTNDILNNPYATIIDNNQWGGQPAFKVSGNNIIMYRTDYPNGRQANIVAPSNITTLSGVVHTVDNLLLPTP